MLSEVLVYLRQHAVPAMIVGGTAPQDLLSRDWSEFMLGYQDRSEDGSEGGSEPLTVRCHQASTPAGLSRLRAEVADFLSDLDELPPSPARDRVVEHLRATRLLVVVEFPAAGVPPEGYEASGWLMNLFVSQADGLVQCDGVGFSDEDDEIILRLG